MGDMCSLSNRVANIELDDWNYRRRIHSDSNQHKLPMDSLIDQRHYPLHFHQQPIESRMRLS